MPTHLNDRIDFVPFGENLLQCFGAENLDEIDGEGVGKHRARVTFRSVVAASSLVDFAASSTFVIEITALKMRK